MFLFSLICLVSHMKQTEVIQSVNAIFVLLFPEKYMPEKMIRSPFLEGTQGGKSCAVFQANLVLKTVTNKVHVFLHRLPH